MINRLFRTDAAQQPISFSLSLNDGGTAPFFLPASKRLPDVAESSEISQGELRTENVRPYLCLSEFGAPVFVPEFYEANYPYPLVLWVSSKATDSETFETRMTALSTRNYLGLQVCPGESLGESQPLETAERLRGWVGRFRRNWHVHTERIFLATTGRDASAVLDVFLARPEWFAGLIAVDGRFGRSIQQVIPFRNPELRGRRVLLASSLGQSAADRGRTIATGRLLNAAGLDVTTRIHESADTAAMSAANDWLMDSILVPA